MLTIQHCRNTENPGTGFEPILFTFAFQYHLFSLRPRVLHTFTSSAASSHLEQRGIFLNAVVRNKIAH